MTLSIASLWPSHFFAAYTLITYLVTVGLRRTLLSFPWAGKDTLEISEPAYSSSSRRVHRGNDFHLPNQMLDVKHWSFGSHIQSLSEAEYSIMLKSFYHLVTVWAICLTLLRFSFFIQKDMMAFTL